MKAVIVGSGLSGATAARILKDRGYDVVIYETRNHIGGNCYDSIFNNILVHNYGPHIFHTDDEEVFSFLSRFTEWTDFELRPKGYTKLGLISLPYSKKTISEIGRELTQEEIIEYIFKDYSEKQWGTDFDNIPKTITNRIPKTKDCENPTWFEGQKYQCIPKEGYTKMFENMLKDINVITNCNKDDWKKDDTDVIIYTGKIDEYYNYRYGKLSYRTLDFIHNTQSTQQKEFIINENTNFYPHTRSYDHSYFNTTYNGGQTIVTKEYSRKCEENDVPFYPIPWGSDQEIYNKYKELADKESNIIFVGRLATYKYLDMWMAVKQVILKLKNQINII